MHVPHRTLAFYRLLLRLYPAQFRQDFEREILLVFQNEWSWQRSLAGRAAFLLSAAAAIFVNAPKEHLIMFANDLRYAVRAFARSQWFTLMAVATLALGMGVNSALFSVIKAVLLEDLPYEKPNQLVRIWVRNPKQGFERDITNYPRLQDWKTRARVLQDAAGFNTGR